MSQDSPYPEAIITDVLLPDVQQYVDTYDADHMNAVRAAIRDITAELGINPHGDLATLVARLAVAINTNGTIKKPAQIVDVAPQNADFTTIQSAIDSITDASSSKIYTIRVYPGIYTENVTLKSYVNLVGMTPFFDFPASIRPASGAPLSIPANARVRISNIYALATSGSALHFTGSGAILYFYNSYIKTNDQSSPCILFADGSSLYLFNTYISAANVGYYLVNETTGFESGVYIKARRSDIRGILNIAPSTSTPLEMYLLRCLFYGRIINTSGMVYLNFRNTHINCDNAIPILIDASEEAMIKAYRSDISSGSSYEIIDRSGASGTIQLWSFLCRFTKALNVRVVEQMTTSNNVVDSHGLTTFDEIQ